MKKKCPEWICTRCYPGATDIARIAAHFYLCKVDGKYCIVAGQGHKDDVIHTYNITPFPDPEKIGKHVSNEVRDKYFMAADDEETRNSMKLDPFCGYNLIRACRKERNYNPHKDGFNFELWLFFLCGKLIK